MRLALEKLKDGPLELREDIPATSWDLDRQDITFVDCIRVCATFTKTISGVEVDTAVTTHKDIVCARCLNQIRQVVTQEFRKNYAFADLDEYLDIDNDIREEVLLNFPVRVLCRPDCKGLCPDCGVNLNTEKCRCTGKGGKKKV